MTLHKTVRVEYDYIRKTIRLRWCRVRILVRGQTIPCDSLIDDTEPFERPLVCKNLIRLVNQQKRQQINVDGIVIQNFSLFILIVWKSGVCLKRINGSLTNWNELGVKQQK